MNDFDTQHGATPAFGDDATDAYTADQATASSEMIDLTDQDAAARARVMRANLDQFDLDAEDLALLSGEVEVDDSGGPLTSISQPPVSTSVKSRPAHSAG